MKRLLIAIAACAEIVGCASTTQTRLVATQLDGRPLADGKFTQLKEICFNRARSAAMMMPESDPQGIGGAIGAAIKDDSRQAELRDATLKSCFAENGALLRNEEIATAH